MPAGLQVWDENGIQLIDTSTIMGRFVGVIDASAMSGSAVIPGLELGIPFAVPLLTSNGSGIIAVNTYPVCTFSGNQVSWVRKPYTALSQIPNCTLLLGVR